VTGFAPPDQSPAFIQGRMKRSMPAGLSAAWVGAEAASCVKPGTWIVPNQFRGLRGGLAAF